MKNTAKNAVRRKRSNSRLDGEKSSSKKSKRKSDKVQENGLNSSEWLVHLKKPSIVKTYGKKKGKIYLDIKPERLAKLRTVKNLGNSPTSFYGSNNFDQTLHYTSDDFDSTFDKIKKRQLPSTSPEEKRQSGREADEKNQDIFNDSRPRNFHSKKQKKKKTNASNVKIGDSKRLKSEETKSLAKKQKLERSPKLESLNSSSNSSKKILRTLLPEKLLFSKKFIRKNQSRHGASSSKRPSGEENPRSSGEESRKSAEKIGKSLNVSKYASLLTNKYKLKPCFVVLQKRLEKEAVVEKRSLEAPLPPINAPINSLPKNNLSSINSEDASLVESSILPSTWNVYESSSTVERSDDVLKNLTINLTRLNAEKNAKGLQTWACSTPLKNKLGGSIANRCSSLKKFMNELDMNESFQRNEDSNMKAIESSISSMAKDVSANVDSRLENDDENNRRKHHLLGALGLGSSSISSRGNSFGGDSLQDSENISSSAMRKSQKESPMVQVPMNVLNASFPSYKGYENKKSWRLKSRELYGLGIETDGTEEDEEDEVTSARKRKESRPGNINGLSTSFSNSPLTTSPAKKSGSKSSLGNGSLDETKVDSFVLLSRIPDFAMITKRKKHVKWDLPSSMLSKKDARSLEKYSGRGTDAERSMNSPAKQWARSLSIPSMQNTAATTLSLNRSRKENSSIASKSNGSVSLKATSPGNSSFRVVPDGKNFDYKEDVEFLQAHGIQPRVSVRFARKRSTLHSVPRGSTIHGVTNSLSPEITLSLRDIVLQKCNNQDGYIPFRKSYPEAYLQKCRKIGEGLYGEVFLHGDKHDKTVIKIIPVEGERTVNGEPQKKFHEVLSEIVIAKELHNLRTNATSSTDCFSQVKNVKCIIGKYPKTLIKLWNDYNEEKESENESPAMFDEEQLYIALETGYGGQDFESFVFDNALEARAIFNQTASALAVGERSLEFEHRDLHWGNVLVSRTNETKVDYKISGEEFAIPTNGVKVCIIDYTLSRMWYLGCCIFNDLSVDPTLFTAQGEYQFEIYRLMRAKTGNDWKRFEPYTNVLWLHYLLMQMINGARYKKPKSKIHKGAIDGLKNVKDCILDYNSAHDFVTNCNLF